MAFCPVLRAVWAKATLKCRLILIHSRSCSLPFRLLTQFSPQHVTLKVIKFINIFWPPPIPPPTPQPPINKSINSFFQFCNFLVLRRSLFTDTKIDVSFINFWFCKDVKSISLYYCMSVCLYLQLCLTPPSNFQQADFLRKWIYFHDEVTSGLTLGNEVELLRPLSAFSDNFGAVPKNCCLNRFKN